MRLLPLILMLAGSLVAGEPAYPLWDGQESVAEYAKKVNLPPTKTLDLGGGVKLELVLIPAGQFIMGTPEPTPVDEDGFHQKIVMGQALLAASGFALLVMLIVVIVQAIRKRQRPKYSLLWLLAMTAMAGVAVLSGLHWQQTAKDLEKARAEYAVSKARYDVADPSEKPAHPVTLTMPFYMGKFTVTQAQFARVIGFLPPTLGLFSGHLDWPVCSVSWDDAQAFCKKLTEQTNEKARLPTEAEWEYACRAGTITTYYSGDTEADLDRVAWYYSNSKNTAHPAGQKEANAFGLFDMHGNVWQWCQDWHAEDFYGKSEAEDPQGPPQGDDRALRGGSFTDYLERCRSAFRPGLRPYRQRNDVGFRVVSPVSAQP